MALLFASFALDLLALLAAVVAYCFYYVHRTYGVWHRKGVHYMKPSFPFGNFSGPVTQKISFGDLSIQHYNSTDKPYIGMWLALRPALFIRDPEIARTIFIKDFNMFADRGLYCDPERDPLSGHLFSLPGERWRQLRNKLSPTFTSGKLKAMFSTIVDCGTPLDKFIGRAAAKGDTIEMRELLAQYTTNIIASVAFGIDVDCIDKPQTEFRRFGRQVFAKSVRNSIRGTLTFLMPTYIRYTGIKSVDAEVEQFFMSIVEQNMKLRETQQVTRKDFFQLLVQLRNSGEVHADDESWTTKVTDDKQKKQLSIGECAAQAFVFYLAGFETSSTTMSFALYELAKNPECMRRVQKEIDEVLQGHGGLITYESVSDIKYLDWVIDETLRKYPPVPFLSRVALQPWTIPGTTTTIDKGTMIIIPATGFQMDPKYFPEPERFIPERFSPEQSAGKTFLDRPYMPFGEGPRNCIGLRLGKMQTKVGLITMLQKYDFELAGVSKLPMVMNPASFLLAPEGGINLKITKRTTA